MLRAIVAASLFALSACGPAQPDPANETAARGQAPAMTVAPPVVPPADKAPGAIDPEHYQLFVHGVGMLVATPGRGVPLRFEESTQAEVETALEEFGTPIRSDGPDDCPAGKLNFLRYPNGIALAFQDGRFAGYWADEGSKGVLAKGDIAPGAPRAALGQAKVEETSFGAVADLDGAIALLSDDGTRIRSLYAGLACIYD